MQSLAEQIRIALTDSGTLLDNRSAPPYRFHVKITQDYYDSTNFVKLGRAGIVVVH